MARIEKRPVYENPPENGNLLNNIELAVLEKLAEAYSEFLKLQQVHGSDNHEFTTAIHNAQMIIMCRPVQREFNKDEYRNMTGATT